MGGYAGHRKKRRAFCVVVRRMTAGETPRAAAIASTTSGR
jgi:hypothetical protein